MTSFFEHQKLSFRKNYMRNLIQLASADGHLDDREVQVLYEIAMTRSLKKWQVDELLKDDSEFEVFIPESWLNKMNLLHDLMMLVHADEVVDEKEIQYVRGILRSFNLPATLLTDLLILFQNGKPSHDAWRDFADAVMLEPQPKFFTVL
jgi:uncharacterized tellurite resistance protein B-like protein